MRQDKDSTRHGTWRRPAAAGLSFRAWRDPSRSALDDFRTDSSVRQTPLNSCAAHRCAILSSLPINIVGTVPVPVRKVIFAAIRRWGGAYYYRDVTWNA